MYVVHLSKEELTEVKALKAKEKRVKVFRRLQALELASQNYKYQDIALVTSVTVDTITDWMRLYSEKGLEALLAPQFTGKRKSRFDDHAEEIKKDIEKNTIATLAELQDWIKRKYSLTLEQSWLFRCCKKNSICLTKRLA
jgi:transposase